MRSLVTFRNHTVAAMFCIPCELAWTESTDHPELRCVRTRQRSGAFRSSRAEKKAAPLTHDAKIGRFPWMAGMAGTGTDIEKVCLFPCVLRDMSRRVPDKLSLRREQVLLYAGASVTCGETSSGTKATGAASCAAAEPQAKAACWSTSASALPPLNL